MGIVLDKLKNNKKYINNNEPYQSNDIQMEIKNTQFNLKKDEIIHATLLFGLNETYISLNVTNDFIMFKYIISNYFTLLSSINLPNNIINEEFQCKKCTKKMHLLINTCGLCNHDYTKSCTIFYCIIRRTMSNKYFTNKTRYNKKLFEHICECILIDTDTVNKIYDYIDEIKNMPSECLLLDNNSQFTI